MRLKDQYYAQSNPPRVYVDYSHLVPIEARPFFKKYWDATAADLSRQGYAAKEIGEEANAIISRAVEIWASNKLPDGSRIASDLPSIRDIKDSEIMDAVSESIKEKFTKVVETKKERTRRTSAPKPVQQPSQKIIPQKHYTHLPSKVKAIFEWNYKKKLMRYPQAVAEEIINDAYAMWLDALKGASLTDADFDDDELNLAIGRLVNIARSKHRSHQEAIVVLTSEGQEEGDARTPLSAETLTPGSGLAYPYLPESMQPHKQTSSTSTLLPWDQPIAGQTLLTETLAPKAPSSDIGLDLNRKIVLLHRGIPDVIPDQPDKWTNKTYYITAKDGTKTEKMILSKAMTDLGKYHLYQNVSQPCPTCRSIARMFRATGLTPEFINNVITYWVITRDSESEK